MDELRDKIIVVAAASEAIRNSVAKEFLRVGCKVLPVSGGFEAYELAQNQTIDVILTAAHLSSGDPCQLLSEVRRLNLDIPVILFASSTEISPTEALHRGFSAHYSTTVLPSVLVEAAARSLQFVNERKKKKVERIVVTAFIELTHGDPPVTRQAPVLNISRGGLFFSLTKDFPKLGSAVEFRLKMMGQEQAMAEGQAVVRWVRERPDAGHLAGVGIEFTEMAQESKDFIYTYVDQTSRRK